MPLSLLAKLGSIVVHVEEGTSPKAHAFDWAAVRSLIEDREVKQWIADLRAAGLVPIKR